MVPTLSRRLRVRINNGSFGTHQTSPRGPHPFLPIDADDDVAHDEPDFFLSAQANCKRAAMYEHNFVITIVVTWHMMILHTHQNPLMRMMMMNAGFDIYKDIRFPSYDECLYALNITETRQ